MDTEYKIPMDHPRITAFAGWVHRTFFQPIDDLLDRLNAAATKRMVNDNLPPELRSK